MSYYSAINDEISFYENEQIDALVNLQIYTIELRRIHEKYLHEAEVDELVQMNDKLMQSKMSVSVIDSPIGKHKKNDNVELMKKYIEIARIFNYPYVRVFSDVFGNDIIENIDRLNSLEEMCQKESISLLLENEVGTSFNNICVMKEYIKSMNRNIKVLFDVCNYYIENGDYLNILEELYEHISYIHIRNYSYEENKFTMLDEGDIDYYQISEILKRRKFQGGLSLESHLTKDMDEQMKK